MQRKFIILGIFDIVPLWRKQSELEDSYQVLSFFVQVFSFFSISYAFIMLITSKFSVAIIQSINAIPNRFFIYHVNFFYSFLISVPFSVLLLMILLSIKREIRINEFLESFNNIVKDNFPENQLQVSLIFYSFSAILGILTGLMYSIVFFIPIYIIFIFLELVFVMFVPFQISLILASILSWALVMYSIINHKLHITRSEVNKNHDSNYYSERTNKILISNKPPIICPYCRSYIAADSKICEVCYEILEV